MRMFFFPFSLVCGIILLSMSKRREGEMTALKILFTAMLCLPLFLLVIHFLLKLVEDVLARTEQDPNVRYKTSGSRNRRSRS